MNKFFKLQERGTTISTEFVAGLTTFLAMAYIIFVNPNILGETGMDQGAVFTATIITTIIGTLVMGLFANYPVCVAPGMGTNAFFAFTVVIGMGFSWEQALAGAFVAGFLFMLLSFTSFREVIINSIPKTLKLAVGVGIGFFITHIGLQNSGIIVGHPSTLVTLGDFSNPEVLLTVFGLIVTLCLLVRKVPAAIFFGMIATAVVGLITGVIDLPAYIFAPIPSMAPTFGALWPALTSIITFEMVPVIFAFLFVEFFDTAGTLMSIGYRAGLINDQGELVDGGKAVLADSSSSVFGSILGTTPTTSYVESLTGIEAGGRTGLTAVFAAMFFVLMLFASGLMTVITSAVTAPALITVGILMASSLSEIEWDKLELAIPAFITIVVMALAYGIADGIASGFLLYPITMTAAGRRKEVHPVMWGMAVIFLLHFALGAK